MRKIIQISLFALSGIFVLTSSSIADKKGKEENPATPTYCPQELSIKQIETFAADKKLALNGREFLVGKKFDQQAGSRYLTLHKDGKAPATISLKKEKIKDNKAICLYTYKFKCASKKKEDGGKEVERTGRIRTHTLLNDKDKK